MKILNNPKRFSFSSAAAKERTRLETGFSMLEAVVVVGVLLALAVGGFIAYGKVTENAKIASVKTAASSVYTAAQAANFDGDASTKMADVLADYNKSQGTIKVELVGSEPTDGGDLCLEATNLENSSIKERMGDCSNPGNGNGSGNGDGSGNTETPDPVTGLIKRNGVDPDLYTMLDSSIRIYSHPDYISWWDLDAPVEPEYTAINAIADEKNAVLAKWSSEPDQGDSKFAIIIGAGNPYINDLFMQMFALEEIIHDGNGTPETQQQLIALSKVYAQAMIDGKTAP